MFNHTQDHIRKIAMPLLLAVALMGADLLATPLAGLAGAGEERRVTALYKAVYKGDYRRTRHLLQRGAGDEINIRTPADNRWPGRTPLFDAVVSEKPRLVELLLAHGADPDIPGDKGEPPLYQAGLKSYHYPSTALVKMLLEAGADPDVWYEGNERLGPMTPLMSALYNERPQNARLLLEGGADPTLKRPDGQSALSAVAGYRLPGLDYPRDFADRQLFDLMLSHVDDRSKLDHTMQWHGYQPGTLEEREAAGATRVPKRGCFIPGAARFSDLAVRFYGDRERWRDIWKLNDLPDGYRPKVGDCHDLPPE